MTRSYHRYQRREEIPASILLHLPPSSQPSPSAGGCWGGASAGGWAARPEFPPCGRTPRTRTACCDAPCRRTSGWRCGSSSCGTPASSAGWTPSRRGCTCRDGLLDGTIKKKKPHELVYVCVFTTRVCRRGSSAAYLCVCGRVSWGRRCRWSLCRRSCRGVSWSRCDTWRAGLTSAGGGRTSGKPAGSEHNRLSGYDSLHFDFRETYGKKYKY